MHLPGLEAVSDDACYRAMDWLLAVVAALVAFEAINCIFAVFALGQGLYLSRYVRDEEKP